MSDSTNAAKDLQSERTVGITFDHIFAEHQNRVSLCYVRFNVRPCAADVTLPTNMEEK